MVCVTVEAFILLGVKNNTKLKVFPFKPLLPSDDAQNVTFFNSTLLSMHCPYQINKGAAVTFRFKE